MPPRAAQITLDFLYRRYAQMLANFCRVRLGDLGSEAEDACHEALLKAYRALPRFRNGPIWPWLATIAANVCIDIQRKRSHLVAMDGRLKHQTVPDPEFEATRRARESIVHRAIDQLPERYRALISERDLEGWSYEEIARLHGVKVATVATALSRARRTLKKAIERLARAEGRWPLAAVLPFYRTIALSRRRWRASGLYEGIRRRAGGFPGQAMGGLAAPAVNAVLVAALIVGPAARNGALAFEDATDVTSELAASIIQTEDGPRPSISLVRDASSRRKAPPKVSVRHLTKLRPGAGQKALIGIAYFPSAAISTASEVGPAVAGPTEQLRDPLDDIPRQPRQILSLLGVGRSWNRFPPSRPVPGLETVPPESNPSTTAVTQIEIPVQ